MRRKHLAISLVCFLISLLIAVSCFAGSFAFRDEFSTDRAAGAVNGSAAEPGVGTRTVTDTENKLTIANGSLTFAGGKASPAWGDPGIWFPAITRVAGRMLISQIVGTSGLMRVGLDADTTGGTSPIFMSFNGTTLLAGLVNSGINVGAITAGTEYFITSISRATGAFYFAKGGTEYPTWRLLQIDSLTDTTPLYPSVANSSGVFTSSFLRIPSTLWLPSPLCSDSFATTFGTSNGLGHAETTGLGSGGAGLAWSNATTYAVSGGKAVNTPVGGTSLVDANASTFEAAGGIYAWDNYATNTVENDSNTLKITYVDSAAGAKAPFTNAADLTADLTVGTWYQVQIDAKANSAVTIRTRIYDGSAVTFFGTTALTTDFATKVGTFRDTNATGAYLYLDGMEAGKIVWLDNWTLKPLTLSQLISVTETSTRDVIATVAISTTPNGTQAGLAIGIDSATDPKYGVIAYHDGTNAKLDKLVNGTWTNVISAEATWADNAEIRVIRDGTSFRLYYNNVQVGSTSTVADVGDGTLHGLFNTHTTPMDNFTVYARGSNGEYVALDRLMSTSSGGFGFGFGFGF